LSVSKQNKTSVFIRIVQAVFPVLTLAVTAFVTCCWIIVLVCIICTLWCTFYRASLHSAVLAVIQYRLSHLCIVLKRCQYHQTFFSLIAPIILVFWAYLQGI